MFAGHVARRTAAQSETPRMRRRVLVPAALALGLALACGAAAADTVTVGQVREICAADFTKYCPTARAGTGDYRTCIKGHFMSFTKPCRKVLMSLRSQMRGQNGGGDAL
jgi:hypothetical protein